MNTIEMLKKDLKDFEQGNFEKYGVTSEAVQDFAKILVKAMLITAENNNGMLPLSSLVGGWSWKHV